MAFGIKLNKNDLNIMARYISEKVDKMEEEIKEKDAELKELKKVENKIYYEINNYCDIVIGEEK